MQVGDLVWIARLEAEDRMVGSAVIVKNEGRGFYKILLQGRTLLMHADYMEVVNESRR